MTDKITPKQQEAWDLYQEALNLRGQQTKVALRFGFILNRIKNEHLYQYMGDGGFETFWQFLAEIKLNSNTAMAYMRVYDYYVKTLKINENDLYLIPFNRLNNLKSKIEDLPKDEQIEWVEKAKVLLRNDFDAELVDKKMKEPKPVVIKKHKECGLLEIYYRVDKICDCGGGLHIYGIPVEIKK